jgi:acetate kinase
LPVPNIANIASSSSMATSVLPSLDARAAAGKTIVCHLGNGVSACALQAGKSMTSTMASPAWRGSQ